MSVCIILFVSMVFVTAEALHECLFYVRFEEPFVAFMYGCSTVSCLAMTMFSMALLYFEIYL